MAARIEYRLPNGEQGEELHPSMQAARDALERTLQRHRERRDRVVERIDADGQPEFLVTTADNEVFVYGLSE